MCTANNLVSKCAIKYWQILYCRPPLVIIAAISEIPAHKYILSAQNSILEVHHIQGYIISDAYLCLNLLVIIFFIQIAYIHILTFTLADCLVCDFTSLHACTNALNSSQLCVCEHHWQNPTLHIVHLMCQHVCCYSHNTCMITLYVVMCSIGGSVSFRLKQQPIT